MAGYIVHDPEGEEGGQKAGDRRRLGWKLPLAAGLVLVAAALAGFVALLGPNLVSASSIAESASVVQEQPALTEARIQAALGDLVWQGEDVGLDPSSTAVTIQNDGSILVSVVDDGAAQDVVPLAAKRLLALAQGIEDQTGADAPAVSWSVSTTAGVQVFEGTLDAGASPSPEARSTKELLSALSSYKLSDATWQDLGLADVPESGGGDSADAAGDAAAADDGSSKKGSDSTAGPASPQSSASPGAGAPGGSSDPPDRVQGGGPTSPSSPSGGAAPAGTSSAPSRIAVTVSVDSTLGGGNSTSASASVPLGSSVLDALEAAGYSVSTQNTQYGIYITGIGGVEASSRDRRGWVYAVNGVEPSCSAANYVLSSGDTIAWAYVSY